MKTLNDFRITKKEVTPKEFEKISGYDLGLDEEIKILFVYLDKFYITVISETEFDIDLCGYSKSAKTIEEAEEILWNEFVEEEVNDGDRDAINTISYLESEMKNPNIKS